MSNIARRTLLRNAAAAAGTLTIADFLASCGGATSSSSSTVTINYWDWLVSQAPWVTNEVSLFQKAHPSIRIKKTTQGSGTYANLFSLAEKSNNVPDVFMVSQQPILNDQVANGWLLPVDKWANTTWRNQFPTGTFYEGSNVFNGKLYTAPLSGSGAPLQLYINNAVFKQAGLTNADGSVKVPKTWDDVTTAAETIVKKSNGSTFGLGFGGNGFTILQWWADVFVRGAGSAGGAGNTFGTFGNLDYRVGKYTYATDRNYADFLNLLVDWKKHNYFYPDSLSITDEAARVFFTQGKFGMTIGGVWNQGGWKTLNYTDYSLTTLPTPDGTLKGYFYNTPGGNFVAISSKTKHPDEAWAWFDWIYSPAAGKRWVQMGEDLSIFTQDNDPSLVTFKPFSEYVKLGSLSLTGPNISVRNPQTAKVLLQTIKPDLGDVITGVYSGQITNIQSSLVDVASRSQQALEKAISQAKQQGANVSINDFIFSDWDITKPYTTKAQ